MSTAITTLHEDTFYAYYKPYRHPASNYDIWGGLGIETFGADLELVVNLPEENLWTVLDGEGKSQWIVPGLRLVNRVCYLVTEIPHNDIEIEFQIKDKPTFLTKIGLARQLNQLKKIQMYRT